MLFVILASKSVFFRSLFSPYRTNLPACRTLGRNHRSRPRACTTAANLCDLHPLSRAARIAILSPCSLLASRIGEGTICTAGETTLGGFLELAAGCDLFVTNDTGTMHVAAAAGVAVLAVFGSTDDQATAPLGPRVRLLKHAVSCSPCLLRHCPVDHRCMRVISVNEVFETSCQILDAVPPSFSTGTAR